MDQQPVPVSLARLGKLFLLALPVCYLAVCVTMAVAQRSLVFFPRVCDSAQVARTARAAHLEIWTNDQGAYIGLKRPSPAQPAEGSVLILYGNGGTAVGCAHYVDDIQNIAAMDVYILEYPGYEDRPGRPSEASFFAAAVNALKMIPTNKPIYLVGESLGSGVASYLAGTFTNRIAGIVLISPFTSVTAVGQGRYPFLPVSLLLVDRFPSQEYLRDYHGKVAITVDGRDNVVPEKFGLRLYKSYDGAKKLWKFPAGRHCEIYLPHSKFWREAIAFSQKN